MSQVVLPDTSLATIVRDEIMNPAGGIIRFIHLTVPFVEEAVVVDTGSVDGTREMLEELQGQYPHLRIFDIPFTGYASSRNFSLAQVQTRRALVLDADERLTMQDYEELHSLVTNVPSRGYNFEHRNIWFPRGEEFHRNHNPRLFDVGPNIQYKQELWENLYEGRHMFIAIPGNCVDTCIAIKHFRSTRVGDDAKGEKWYSRFKRHRRTWGPDKFTFTNDAPHSQIAGFEAWKEYNPREKEFV